MSWGSGARRRADEFDALVGARSTAPTHRDAELLSLVGALRAVPDAPARPEFVAELRELLLAEAAAVLSPDPAPTPASELDRLRLPSRTRPGQSGQPRRQRRLAAVVGGLAVLGASAGVAAASQSALPGDALYPVKRALESAHAGLSTDDGSKGATIMASAGDRLDEVDALTRQDEIGADARIADTLDTFTAQAREASDLLLADYTETADARSVAELRDFASSSLDRLAVLEPRIPESAHDELVRAAGTLAAIDSEAGQRCPTCGGTPITAIPGILLAGLDGTDPPLGPASELPATSTGADDGGRSTTSQRSDGPVLPDVDAGLLGPGSVQGPSGSASAGAAGPAGSGGGATGRSDPLRDLTGTLTDPLTGGGATSGPSVEPSLPGVGDIVGGSGDTLDDLLNGGLPSALVSPSPLG